MPESIVSIGLDIDDKSVKFAKIKQINGQTFLQRFDVKELPSSGDKIAETGKIIKDILKDERSDTPIYLCALGPHLSIRHITIPVIPDDEVAEAVKWEAKNLIPFPIDTAVIDYYKIGKVSEKNIEKYNIMLAVAGQELTNNLYALVKEVGIKIAGISALPFALYSLLEQQKKSAPGEIIAIIDIGAEAASINLYKGDLLQFTREISVAGDSFTKAMTGLLVADHWQLNLTYEQAEDIKLKHGIPSKESKESTGSGIPLVHIYEMMAPTMRRLQNEIQRSFDYYKEEFREEKIDKVYLTGGSSKLKNLDDYLSNVLGIKVEPIDPLENIKLEESSGLDRNKVEEASPRLSLAIGLALDKCNKINFHKIKEKPKAAMFNLHLDKYFEKLKIPVHMPANSAVIGLVVLITLAISYNVYLAGKKAYFKQMLASKQAVLTDVKALVERRLILDQIAKEETHIRETLSQITTALPSGILLTDLRYDNSKRQIWLSGEANNTKAVGTMLKSFEDSPNFKQTVLIEARKAIINNVQKVVFKVTFILS